MASYSVSALALDQRESSARFILAASVFDHNGLGVPNLSASNFAVYNLTGEARFTVQEAQDVAVPGFYRLFLRKTESITHVGDCVLALIVTGRHHAVGRVPETPDGGQTLVKVKVV